MSSFKSKNSKKKVFDWKKTVSKFNKPHLTRSVWQLTSTLVLYFTMWVLMYLSLKLSYWVTLALAPIAAGLLVRIFIIFHDCTHGSFFKSQKANDIIGNITGLLVFTPYDYWRHEHAIHHASAGDLDHRGVGDIWTMTVKEYLKASRWVRFKYRFIRNPIILFLIAPIFLFLIKQRFAPKRVGSKERRGIYKTNLWLCALIIAGSCVIGFKAFVMIQLPILFISSSAGLWLFYVQHQFEGVYWERSKNWDYVTEALKGSSFYKLPKILQWFTGNIGFHHIHHLSPQIPNYFLEKCHKANAVFQKVTPVTLWSSLKSLTFRLWDEESKRLVGYSYLKRLKYL